MFGKEKERERRERKSEVLKSLREWKVLMVEGVLVDRVLRVQMPSMGRRPGETGSFDSFLHG